MSIKTIKIYSKSNARKSYLDNAVKLDMLKIERLLKY